MRAVRCDGAGGVAVCEVETPPPPSSDFEQVLVEIRAVGICGTDLAARRAGRVTATLGHEFSGVLEDGTPVTVQPNLFCGTCALCESGRTFLCPQSLRRFYGLSIDGGMADVVSVEARAVRRLPDGMAVEHGALAEPLAVGVHAVARCELEPGEPLLVVGAGSIGVCVAAAAVAAGHDTAVVARHPHQADAVARVGASIDDGSGRLRRVVEAAGSQSALDDAVARTLPGGTVVTLGGGSSWTGALGMRALAAEVALQPVILYTEAEFAAAIAMLHERPELAAVLATHHTALEDAPRAFEIAADVSAHEAIKVQLVP